MADIWLQLEKYEGGVKALSDIVAAGGWEFFASVLKEAAADPAVQKAAAVHYEVEARKHAERQERWRQEEIKRQAARQRKRTKRMFRPPYADNQVVEGAPPIPILWEQV